MSCLKNRPTPPTKIVGGVEDFLNLGWRGGNFN